VVATSNLGTRRVPGAVPTRRWLWPWSVAAAIVFLYPFNSTAASPAARELIVVAMVLTLTAVMSVSRTFRGLEALVVPAFVATLWLGILLAHGARVRSALPFVILPAGAYVLGTLAPDRVARILLFLGAVTSVGVGFEFVTRTHPYYRWLGLHRLWVEGPGFRAQGPIGHPLPTAAFLVAGATGLFVWRRRSGRLTALRATALVAYVAAVGVATGSKSALIVAPVVLAVDVLGTHRLRVNVLRKVALPVAYAALLSVLLIAFLSSVTGQTMPGSRALSFSHLTGSTSVKGRLSGLAFGGRADLATPCGGPCSLTGHGYRALQASLIRSDALSGASTVDNAWLTSFYDFGLLGVLTLAGLAVVALRGLFSTRAGALNAAGGAVTLALLLWGSAFDVVYWYAIATAMFATAGIAASGVKRERTC
jgi:hypothetical protein